MIYLILFIILISLIINYFQQPEILFDIDDIKRYIITAITITEFIGKIITILYPLNFKKYFLNKYEMRKT